MDSRTILSSREFFKLLVFILSVSKNEYIEHNVWKVLYSSEIVIKNLFIIHYSLGSLSPQVYIYFYECIKTNTAYNFFI